MIPTPVFGKKLHSNRNPRRDDEPKKNRHALVHFLAKLTRPAPRTRARSLDAYQRALRGEHDRENSMPVFGKRPSSDNKSKAR
jgi:hypothetical protein